MRESKGTLRARARCSLGGSSGDSPKQNGGRGLQHGHWQRQKNGSASRTTDSVVSNRKNYGGYATIETKRNKDRKTGVQKRCRKMPRDPRRVGLTQHRATRSN